MPHVADDIHGRSLLSVLVTSQMRTHVFLLVGSLLVKLQVLDRVRGHNTAYRCETHSLKVVFKMAAGTV